MSNLPPEEMTAHAGQVHGWDDGVESELFADVAGKVRSDWDAVDGRLNAALDEIGERVSALSHAIASERGTKQAAFDSACDVPRLLAAIDKALELTDPLRNPTLGGTFLGAVGVQVREAILAELESGPVVRAPVLDGRAPGGEKR